MSNLKTTQLLLNADKGHGETIKTLLENADNIEFLVAFAKKSAMDDLFKPLKKLARGLNARIGIGLDFHLTDPETLRKLLALSRSYKLKLYLSNSKDTFHPKIYAFGHGGKCSVIVGSANFTHGGLYSNHEASIVIEDDKMEMMNTVIQSFNNLIKNETLIPAEKSRIDKYEREYIIHDAYRKIVKNKTTKAIRANSTNFAALSEILEIMNNDDTKLGLVKQKKIRKKNMLQSKRMLKSWADIHGRVDRGFLVRFEDLISLFHSGGLHRAKNRIAKKPKKFMAAVADVVRRPHITPGEAFAILHGHFLSIPGAGINLLTEILHALDNTRYAVMNQNAVSGLALAGIHDYPIRPNKNNVTAEDYTRYCQHANIVRRELGLTNFTELDALFNYAYWDEGSRDEADD